MIGRGRIAGFPEGVTRRDLLWGAVGATAGSLLFVWASPDMMPGAEPLSGEGIAAWVLALAAFGGLGFLTAVLSLLDVREHRLPNGLLLWGSTWVLGLLSLSSLVSKNLHHLVLAWVCAVAFALLLALIWWRVQAVLGAGDVKLMPMAAFAAIWSSSSPEPDMWDFLTTALFRFPFVMIVGALFFALVSLARGRKEFPAASVILGASWLTMLMNSEALGQLLNR